jgi:NADH:ubiquinone oxidoreductase subunit E
MSQTTRPLSPTDNWPEVEAACRRILGEKICQFIDEVKKDPRPESHLIAVLHRVQAEFGYLGASQLDAVAQLMQIPAAKVSGVATFYHYFRLQPRGRFVVNICFGTACYVKGADRVAERFMNELGIQLGETSKDGMFTVEGCRCLGMCALAPVITVNGEVWAQITADKVPSILEQYLRRTKGS